MADEQLVPHVAVKTHLDGDPKLRPDEIREWNAIRREYGLDEILVIILLPDESVTDSVFPGYQMHGWAIRQDANCGCVKCEREQIDITIIPDEES